MGFGFFNNIQMACPLLAGARMRPPSGRGQGQVVFTAAQHMHAPLMVAQRIVLTH